MVDYIMAVKSGPAGACRKSFGKLWLGPLYRCGKDAIFAGFGSARRGGLSRRPHGRSDL